jgi:small subunit ribosomal protein S6
VAPNNYETVFIAEPEIPNDQVDQLIQKIKQIVEMHKGVMTGEDRWGLRRLAYSIQGHREGYYAVLNFSAEPSVVSAVEHLFNVTDSVMRHLTVRVIKKNKTFPPRRERPAGAAASRTPSRPRAEAAPKAAGAEPAAAPAAPEGGKNA